LYWNVISGLFLSQMPYYICEESQRSSAQLVGTPEQQLEVPGSIPRWDEFWASLKKSLRCASSALGYLCLFATLRQGPL
jgi:hypothetical protein